MFVLNIRMLRAVQDERHGVESRKHKCSLVRDDVGDLVQRMSGIAQMRACMMQSSSNFDGHAALC